MIQLASFQEITSSEFDEVILQKIIVEMHSVIKENANLFRLQIELNTDSLEAKLYKNSLTGHFMSKGFKIVNFNEFMFVDWSCPNIHPTANPAFVQHNVNYIGTFFTAEELYLSLTGNVDLRKVSYRPLLHKVDTEIKRMNLDGRSDSLISLGISTTMTSEQLNNLFAPDILKINMKYGDALLSFLDGGLFKISLYSLPETYTDIPYEVLFGTKIY